MAITKALEVGDIVKLKSGGPIMTVIRVASPQTVQVSWFTKDLSLRVAEITINSLVPVKGGK